MAPTPTNFIDRTFGGLTCVAKTADLFFGVMSCARPHGMPRLRRSFALPAPGWPASPCLLASDFLVGVSPRGMPRLRRSFALPAPGRPASPCLLASDFNVGKAARDAPAQRSFALPAPGRSASPCLLASDFIDRREATRDARLRRSFALPAPGARHLKNSRIAVRISDRFAGDTLSLLILC